MKDLYITQIEKAKIPKNSLGVFQYKIGDNFVLRFFLGKSKFRSKLVKYNQKEIIRHNANR